MVEKTLNDQITSQKTKVTKLEEEIKTSKQTSNYYKRRANQISEVLESNKVINGVALEQAL